MKKIKNYPIELSPLYRLRNERKLALLLQVKTKTLHKLRSDSFYIVYTKQGTKQREIQEPKKQLKQVHKKIKKLLQRIETPSLLISGKKGNSFVTNAQQHLASRYFLITDIEGFYKNSRREFVFKFFKFQMKMSEDIAWLMTDLVTYKDFIPTGSPTSQIIAYFAYAPTFQRINEIANQHDCKLSVYVDDLTISSKKPIPTRMPHWINNEFKKVFHQIKKRKTRFFYPFQHKIITGCCISPKGALRVPNRIRLRIKQEDKNHISGKSIKPNRLLGMMLSARQIEPNIYKYKFFHLKKEVFQK
ncbi:MAG: reverse transcriptase family protein [Bdellovibrionales bacterium]|nr:reverse transcriptase family protein [Bdellovibrionales bacterium]